jgi:hypothetical protein
MPGWRIVAVFCDLTTGLARPARDGAIAAAPSRGFDVLLMTGLDRLTRDPGVAHDLLGRLSAASVSVCTLDRSTSPTRRGGPVATVLAGGPAEHATHRLRALTAGKPIPALAIGPAAHAEQTVKADDVSTGAEVVDYFGVYRCTPEAVYDVPALANGQPPLTIGIAAAGGGTVGRSYADNGWIYTVHLDGDLVASGADLRSGGFPRTHQQMAAELAIFLADGDRTRTGLREQSERLSAWAGDIEEGDTDD